MFLKEKFTMVSGDGSSETHGDTPHLNKQRKEDIRKLHAMHFLYHGLETAPGQASRTQEGGKNFVLPERMQRQEANRFLDHCRPAKKVYDQLAPFLDVFQQCQKDLEEAH